MREWVASITDKWIANVMQNNTTEALQLLVTHIEHVCVCVYIMRMHSFTTPPCLSDVTTWHQNITLHSYLTAHISSMLEDTHTHEDPTTEFLSGSEGHDSGRISRGCRRGQNEGWREQSWVGKDRKSVSRIDGGKGRGGK